MITRFNADEILEMAQEIERNGADFYRKAANIVSDQSSQKTLAELAEMEDEHEQTFVGMRNELTVKEREPVSFDPDNELSLYLRAMADKNVFDTTVKPDALLAGKSMDEILRTAIGMEKDSIVFYLGLRELVPERLGKGRLDDIIAEEYSHITILTAKIKGK